MCHGAATEVLLLILPGTLRLLAGTKVAQLHGAVKVERNLLLGSAGCLWPAEITTTCFLSLSYGCRSRTGISVSFWFIAVITMIMMAHLASIVLF